MTAPAAEILDDQRRLRQGAWAPLARDVVRVAGPDAGTYLQGQLSQDVQAVEEHDAAWSLLLQPQGKVDAWVRVTRLAPDELLLDVDEGWGEAVVARLTRFLLRTKAEVALDDRWCFRAVRGPVTVDLTHPTEATVLALPVWWRGLVGYDLLAPVGAPVALDVPEVGAEALEALRVECGVPAMGAELTEATIPAEAGQWLVDASVSFTKGCYTGQELVARVDSRGGNVPRHLRGVVVDGDDLPPVGAVVEVGGEAVGAVTSRAWSAQLGGPVALASVRRAVEPPAAAVLRWPGGEAAAEVRHLPLVEG